MRLAALYSGGKDSTFAIYRAISEGHQVTIIITLIPDREDSLLFHYPNAKYTSIQAECMNIPLIQARVKSDLDNEVTVLKDLLQSVRPKIDGIVSGAIASRFQFERFLKICNSLDLQFYTPLWGIDQSLYLHNLVAENFTVMISAVSANGLDQRWLGRIIDDECIGELETLSKRYGFNLAFEGGEAETFVLDAPIFRKRIRVKESRVHWDGIRGYLEILDLETLTKHA